MKRHATAVWNGDIKSGSGHLTTQSKVLDSTKYTFKSRFGDEDYTNPEELIAAAHAGCFAMKLDLDLSELPAGPYVLQAAGSHRRIQKR